MLSSKTNEVLELVAPYVRNPIPKVLSRPPRSALRQNDLVALNRTNKCLREITTPLLYTDFITDDLPFLLDPTSLTDSLPSFRHTRILRIEYSLKGQGPTYEDLCSNGIWERKESWAECGPTSEELEVLKDGDGRREIKRLSNFPSRHSNLANPFPNLETIVIASIYGPDYTWKRMDDNDDMEDRIRLQTPLQLCASKFATFIRTSPARHVCMRDLYGPLSNTSVEVGSEADPHVTLHFTWCDHNLAFRLGPSSRWLFQDDQEISDWSCLLPLIGVRIITLQSLRTRTLAVLPPPTLDLTITFSCGQSSRATFDAKHILFSHRPALPRRNNTAVHILSPNVQAARAVQLGKEAVAFTRQDPYGRAIIYKDKIRWESSVGASCCSACGSG